MLHNHIQKRFYGRGGFAPVLGHPILLSGTIYSREVQLPILRTEFEHKVKYRLMHLLWGTVFLIHLVDNHNWFKLHLNGFLQDKAGLRHRPLKGIYKQEYSIGHIQYTLYFSSEVRVARSVYNIDFGSLIVHRNILRENCDSTFALQIVVVQDEIACLLVVAKEGAVV